MDSEISLLLRSTCFVMTCVLTACGGGGNSEEPLAGKQTTYRVGGTVSGLMGSGLVLASDIGGELAVSVNGEFNFPTVISGTRYSISVRTQPSSPAQTCGIANGSGEVAARDADNILVTCITDNPTPGPGGPSTYSVGGTLTGLTSGESIRLQYNGNEFLQLTTNGPFEFNARLPSGTSYIVTIATPPANGATCTFAGQLSASGQIADASIASVYVTCRRYSTWTWVTGSMQTAAPGVYGGTTPATVVPSFSNTPGARRSATTWVDSSGNMWLFGGFGFDGSLNGYGLFNDLWRYNPHTNVWTWVKGASVSGAASVYGGATPATATSSSANGPGARSSATGWIDAANNLWLFGGTDSTSGSLNDLWRYDPTTNVWTWVHGSNINNALGIYGGSTPSTATPSTSTTPGARNSSASWIDSTGNLWLFGGGGYGATGASSALNDLWRYSPGTNRWTWISGVNSTGASGVYGGSTPSTSIPSSTVTPGARNGAIAWRALNGTLWLFGGYGVDSIARYGALNDLWQFNPDTQLWTWVNGSSAINTQGVYGGTTPGTAVPSADNTPGARRSAHGWAHSVRILSGSSIISVDEFWLFGGEGIDATNQDGRLNDLWKFTPRNGRWTWMGGASNHNGSGVFGTRGSPSTANVPDARVSGATWYALNGDFWMFGGLGNDAYRNELWKFTPPCGPTC
jgi:N-acetylneuraminic acid mutarotase